MAGIGGIFAGLGQAVQGYNQADAQAIERRKALQALSIQEMQYQQAKQAQQREQAAAAANFGALTAIPGALPGAQPIPQAAGPAPAAPQPQGPQPPMPGQSSMPSQPTAAAQPPRPVGAQPGGPGVPPVVPSPGQSPGGPAPAASLSNPGAGSPGTQQLSQPADMLRQMAMEIRRANPGIDPMTAMEAIKQRIDLQKGLEPDLKNQITLLADQMKNSVAIQKITQDANNAIMRANTAEEVAKIRGDFATSIAQIGAASRNSRRSPATMALQKYLEENPDATSKDISQFAAKFKETGAAETAFGTGKQGNAVRSFNVAISHLDTLADLGKALGNNDVQALNSLKNKFKTQFGSEVPTDFNAAKRIVADEIVKAVTGAAGALGDREQAEQQINAAQSPQQLAGVIQTYKKLMAGQLQGLRQQYEQSTGRTDFDDLLSSNAKTELEAPSGGGGDILQQARDAIAQGAPRDKVIERLKQQGVDPGGL